MGSEPAILVTGGTGTFGRAFIRRALRDSWRRVISLSRDELKAAHLTDEFGAAQPFKAFLGDVRDRDRLMRAFHGVNTVVHAAALKRVDQGAYSPSEILQTNITGTVNVVTAAIDSGVKRVVVISSDKAVAPTNIYGASKMCAEHFAVQANNYSTRGGTRIAAVRYGNVLGSRGSVVHLWRRQAAAGERLTVTDPQMTRFVMTIEQAVALVNFALADMQGGEVYVPVLPAARMVNLAAAVRQEFLPLAGDDWWQQIGLRPGGEKMAEALLNEEEPARTRLIRWTWAPGCDACYAVLPSHHDWTDGREWDAYAPVDPGLVYRSDGADNRWLSDADLRGLLDSTEALR